MQFMLVYMYGLSKSRIPNIRGGWKPDMWLFSFQIKKLFLKKILLFTFLEFTFFS